MTMSVDGHAISFQDLIIDLESIARRFVESYDWLGCDMLKACCDMFASDFSFHCPADPNQVSFAGEWYGLSGFQEFLNRFFATFTRNAGTLKPIYMVSQNRVVARFKDEVCFHGYEPLALWVNLHFQFQDGFLIRIDDEFYSLNLSQFLERMRLVQT